MNLLRPLRLILALLALASAMAGAAAGSAAMARATLPCHEPAFSEVAAGHESHGGSHGESHGGAIVADARVAAKGQGVALATPPAPEAVRLHLCCVLSQLLVTPVDVPALQPRLPRALALALPAGTERDGRVLPIPVPPPRSA